MRRLKNGVAGNVIDIAARGDADAADLSGEGVAKVITIEVRRGDYVKIVRASKNLLQGNIGDCVFHQDALRGLAPWPAIQFSRAEFPFGNFISPISERAFGVLHDIAFVDEGDALPLIAHRIIKSCARQPLRSR